MRSPLVLKYVDHNIDSTGIKGVKRIRQSRPNLSLAPQSFRIPTGIVGWSSVISPTQTDKHLECDTRLNVRDASRVVTSDAVKRTHADDPNISF